MTGSILPVGRTLELFIVNNEVKLYKSNYVLSRIAFCLSSLFLNLLVSVYVKLRIASRILREIDLYQLLKMKMVKVLNY